MGARAWGATRSTLLPLMLAVVLGGGPAEALPTEPAEPRVGAVVGAGIWEKAACLGCVGILLGAGGFTIGGVIFAAGLNPEYTLGCALTCELAF